MNSKKNSLSRLEDIMEEDVAQGSQMMEEITTHNEEEDNAVHHEDEISSRQSTTKVKQGSSKNVEEGKGTRSKDVVSERHEKRQVQIDWPFEEEIKPKEKKKSIYDLDSYRTSNISVPESFEPGEMGATDQDESQDLRYSVSLGISGIARIHLSPLTQKIVGCVIGENVTTEYPWIYVKKEIIEDNLDLHEDNSDFLPVKHEVNAFPDKNILIGYAPSPTEEGQFYICLTESGRDAVMKHIEALRVQQEDRVRNAAYRSVGEWTDLGSGEEVDNTIVKKTRALFEIEVESTSELLNAPITLIDRNVADQRDGYIELLPYRQTFDNVTRKIVSKGEQTSLPVVDNVAQTEPSMLFNTWFQYNYEYEPINTSAYNEDEKRGMKRFLNRYTSDICDKVNQNSTWDIYTDDYGNLVRNKRDTQAPVSIAYTEHQSYYDEKLSMEKVINDLCWHPLWTGIAAASYSEHCKSDNLIGPYPHDEVLIACAGNNQVLIWSFNDCLTPKLILECPRKVTSISICPLDGNVIVGGCASGQIAIWSIYGKFEEVEAVTVQTPAQVKYRMAMKSLMSWMRDSTSPSVIKPAAMSSLQYSHKAPITEVVWLPVYDKVDKNGRISSLPADSRADQLGWQLATSSMDGTIAFWNLRWRPPDDKDKAGLRGKKKKKTVPRPDPLVQSISPFKALDGIFRPEYMLEITYPEEERRAVITTMNINRPKIRKEQIEPFPFGKDNATVRKYYKALIEKPDYQLKPTILIGTIEGDVVSVTWEGYEFSTGAMVNCENAKWLWGNCNIHDGPVTHSVRSEYLKDVLVTVGGKVFAVWRDDFGEPIFWQKSHVRYTACCWGTLRPTVLILARGDGTAEIWDFIVKSHEPSFTQGVSGRIITGIYAHKLYLNPQCIAFCDFNGTLRVFTTPADLLSFSESDIEWMRKFVDREVDRIRQFKLWQKSWNETNLENIEKRKKLAELEAEKKRLEAEEKIKAEMDELIAKQKTSKAAITSRKPAEFLEEANERWKSMELKRMKEVLLEKKGLSPEILERQRAPVLQLRQDARRKKRKIREIMQLQDKIFQETTDYLFPEQYKYEHRSTDTQRLSVSQEEEEETAEMMILINEQPPQAKYDSPEEELIHNFKEIQKEALESMKKNRYEPNFEWRNMLRQGQMRRRTMDIDLTGSNKPKGREFSQEVPEVCEPSTDRNTASGYEVYQAPTGANETGP